MPKDKDVKKVLVIGSGPIVVGQAAEFDYAGTQACMTLKEAGCEIVLINNNPATIMTDETIADSVYFEPLTVNNIEAIIKKEQPDGLLASVSGQTGLNLAFDLDDQGIIEKYNIKVLGTPIESIKKGEDRDKFRSLMHEIAEPVPESEIIEDLESALMFSERVGFPIIIRPAYTLGGSGGGIAANEDAFIKFVTSGLRASPINQCLIEKSIAGWKEIEMEVIRDKSDNCVVVCHMENIDPVGIHTGDSVVVAPVQTLNESDLQMLKEASKKIVKEIGIIGACNVQLALDPHSKDYFIIEINPRVSRSSALASKATGYPIAKVATKLSLGYTLDEMIYEGKNMTYAMYEPELDYVIVKFPRFPYDKFKHADRILGTQMKATGEIMAIGDNLLIAMQKAIRSLELELSNFYLTELKNMPIEQLRKLVYRADDRRFFAILEAFSRGVELEVIYETTKINKYFLTAMANLVKYEQQILKTNLEDVSVNQMLKFKQTGFTDRFLATAWGKNINAIETKRTELNVHPRINKINAVTEQKNESSMYYYTAWDIGAEKDQDSDKEKVLIIGSGPIRIGQGVEFDYCSVQSVLELQKNNYETILVNNNPSTVSTDFEIADKLYFEPITVEDVLHIIQLEKIEKVMVQFGGQTAINLVSGLEDAGIDLVGTSENIIDTFEDRDRFYEFMKEINLPHIPGITVYSEKDLLKKITDFGYPVLLRPSYVIGGKGMLILKTEKDLQVYLEQMKQTNAFPILLDAYYPGLEIEVDVLSDGREIVIPGIFEHIEKAGVHSGDSMAVTPPVSISEELKQEVVKAAKKIAIGIGFKGIFNIQFVHYKNKLYVLEVNPRASRTVPVMSKVTGINMISVAINLLLGKSLSEIVNKVGLMTETDFYTIKAPVFSTNKLPGVDPKLVPEMKSTGELIAVSNTYTECIKKAIQWCEPVEKSFLTADKEIYICGNEADFSHLELALAKLDLKLITEAEMVNFDEWLKSDHAFAIYSDKDNGMERERGLEFNLLIMSAKESLETLAKMTDNTELVCSIQERNKFNNLKEGVLL